MSVSNFKMTWVCQALYLCSSTVFLCSDPENCLVPPASHCCQGSCCIASMLLLVDNIFVWLLLKLTSLRIQSFCFISIITGLKCLPKAVVYHDSCSRKYTIWVLRAKEWQFNTVKLKKKISIKTSLEEKAPSPLRNGCLGEGRISVCWHVSFP